MDVINLLNDLDQDDVIEIAKCSAFFIGGFIAGYGIKKVLDSSAVENIKNNAVEYFESTRNATGNIIDLNEDDE